MFSHLKSRTVLTGIAVAALGLFYQAEDAGFLPMYLSADWVAKLTTIAGLLTWYFRVNNQGKVGADGRLTAEEIERLKAETRAEVIAEIVPPKP